MHFVQHHRNAILLGLAALVAAVAVSMLVANARAKTHRELQIQVAEAVMLMQSMQHARAALLFDSLLERNPGGDLGMSIRYHAATAHYLSGNTRRARALFESILAANPKDPLRRYGAQEGLANCLEADGDLRSAAEAYERLADAAPHEGLGPRALTQAVRCYEQAGDFAAATRVAQHLAQLSGDNEYWQKEADRIVARMSILQRHGPVERPDLEGAQPAVADTTLQLPVE